MKRYQIVSKAYHRNWIISFREVKEMKICHPSRNSSKKPKKKRLTKKKMNKWRRKTPRRLTVQEKKLKGLRKNKRTQRIRMIQWMEYHSEPREEMPERYLALSRGNQSYSKMR